MSQTALARIAPAEPELRQPLLEPQQWILLVVLLLEFVVFSFTGHNFLTLENAQQIPQQNVELGLLALAMTPVIVTGGIDLSVGSLLGLCAVLFGKLWRDAHMPIEFAAACAVVIGMIGGLINALLITRINIPPLIVTLGTYSLYRGIAEGITGGSDNFTNFPAAFLNFGNGWQLPILAVAAIAFYLLLHRSTLGRALVAIGFSPQGARHAGIPVQRRIALVYILSGLCAGLAAVIYAARIGQARSDAGMEYELAAITAVVLGGTSIFGGRGSIIGTILGFFAIAILTNGVRLSDQPDEVAAILKGVLLLIAIGADWRSGPKRSAPSTSANEEFNMRNSQLAVLSIVILIAAGIVTGGNYLLLKGIGDTRVVVQTTGQPAPDNSEPTTQPARQITIGMMPKATGNDYFIACHQGADEAAKELGVTLLWDGPTDSDPGRQNEIVDSWITRGVDAIAVSVVNRDALSTALRRAKAKGIKVITWDADADPDARDFFVNQATPEGIGDTLMDDAAAAMNNTGKFAIITASLTDANQQEWIKYVNQRIADKYPNIQLVDTEPCNDNQDKAFEQAKTILNAHPDVSLIMAVCSPGVPGAAEAVKQSGRTDVKVVGLGLPKANAPYVHAGITQDVVLWNTMDLGYLTVYAANADVLGTLAPGATSFTAGRLGTLQVQGDNVLLGKPFSFTKDNIDQFNF
ncbi:MAG: substrate-binding domain-containing protein [Tepidisphaeraceae bacterium]|jgi:rhamnose transport system permease protein